ncbi:conserved hypothetical protein [Thermotomaculum hydrothermale]|uniref:DUF4139 domain-containing protein n=1 Tax=Thermotomaculum hydrothermale TaxID=981385 RepID=A0A7R6PQ22_9BACT|nr:DUF4139 domain-containing protein [Thermotomaculum hydrothermale]BBB33216.1 conserved hypothetical protein [Thermotomaculum hydrothermale]
MRKGLILFVLLCTFFAFSSEVRVFNDKVVYYPDKPSSFIGFNKDVNVVCNNEVLPIFKGEKVPQNFSLFKTYIDYIKLKNDIATLKKQKEVIDKAFRSLQLKSNGDFALFLKNSENYAKKYSSIERKLNALKVKREKLEKLLKSSTYTLKPYFCDLPEKIYSFKMEFQGIQISTKNKLFINNDGKTCRVVKELSLLNRSGIDIKADEFYILAMNSSRYFEVIEFYPWTITGEPHIEPSDREGFLGAVPQTRRMMKTAAKEKMPVVNQLDTRIFLLNNISLPSNGVEKKFKIDEKEVKLTKRLVVYPYQSLDVYKEYSFKLPFAPLGSNWQVFAGKESYSNVTGTFDKETDVYRIFAGKEYAIDVKREPVLNMGSEEGFFSKKKIDKKGYKITLRNLGNKEKRVFVIDRIPVSTLEGIVVKDVKVKGLKKYNINKEGKLSGEVNLKPHDKIVIEVTFSVVYPADMDIYY